MSTYARVNSRSHTAEVERHGELDGALCHYIRHWPHAASNHQLPLSRSIDVPESVQLVGGGGGLRSLGALRLPAARAVEGSGLRSVPSGANGLARKRHLNHRRGLVPQSSR